MRNFFKHIIIFIFIPISLVAIFFNTRYALYLNEAEVVYDLVQNIDDKSFNSSTILLGDSVCRQFFENRKSDDVYCLCENQSYEVVGNYLLLLSLLKNESNFENLVLVINPITLTLSLNQPYTYNYFVKPFESMLPLLESEEKSYINNTFPSEGIFKYKFSNFELPEAYDIMTLEKKKSYQISELNLKYLNKIDSLARKRKINFKIVSPPLPLSNKEFVIKMRYDKTNVLLNDYYNSITFYPSVDSKDGVHHKEPRKYITENREQLDALLKINNK